MPSDAVVLSVGTQNGDIYVWALVNTTKPMSRKKFFVFGTGHPFPEGTPPLKFVGTVHMTAHIGGGFLVWHVFVEKPPRTVPD